jgi:diguanylate cyclase (GGDEF)-like protein/PAS domain S-box-containing protein
MRALLRRAITLAGGGAETPPLVRLRYLFFALLAVTIALLIPQLLLADTPAVVRLSAAAVLAMQFVNWRRMAQVGQAGWWSDPLDASGFLLVALALGGLERAFPMYFTALYLRAFCGSGRRVALATTVYIAVLVLARGILESGPPFSAQTLSLIPNIASIAFVANLLRASFERRGELERELRSSETRFRTLVQNSSDVIVILGDDGTIRYSTPSVLRLLGSEDLAGANIQSLLHTDDAHAAAAYLKHAAADVGARIEWRLLHRDGMWLHTDVLSSGTLHDPVMGGIVLTMRNVTENRAVERRLRHEALHDPLTDLPNRTLLRERIENAMAAAHLERYPLAVLFVDLDDFKTVNDTFGHQAGDELLIAVSKRLRDCLRPNDTAARLGGDEFALLLSRLREPDDAEIVARRIVLALQRPFRIAGQELSVHASLGIAESVDGSETADELLANADSAMYVAKAGGKARYEVFRPGMRGEGTSIA